jgi:hypothetical protein
MPRFLRFLACAVLLSGLCAQAQATAQPASSAEMQRIFDADQAVRQNDDPSKINWTVINKQDAERRAAVRRLIDSGALHTARDFELAAWVFQHGASADDFLLAHSLALVALAKGDAAALPIATATLDRYLQKTGRPQIYGTQLNKQFGAPWTEEPYDRAAIPDALRVKLGVHTAAEQANKLNEMNQPDKK